MSGRFRLYSEGSSAAEAAGDRRVLSSERLSENEIAEGAATVDEQGEPAVPGAKLLLAVLGSYLALLVFVTWPLALSFSSSLASAVSDNVV